jgi:hypothetical protein
LIATSMRQRAEPSTSAGSSNMDATSSRTIFLGRRRDAAAVESVESAASPLQATSR